MATASQITSTASSTLDIWRSRIRRELMRLTDPQLLPTGIVLHEHHLDEENATFYAIIDCHVPLPEGSTALGLIPLVQLKIIADYNGKYPFEAPVSIVEQGIQFLPPSMINLTSKCLAPLPQIAEWTPSQTITSLLNAFVAEVQKHDPQSVTSPKTGKIKRAEQEEDTAPAIHIDQVHGRLFLCHEVYPNRVVHQVYLAVTEESLLKLRLHRQKPNHVVIMKESLLCDIAKISFKSKRSLTVFYSKEESCNTFFTSESQECVRCIQENLKKMGVEGERKTTQVDDDDDNSLMKFASSRAKDFSKKMYGKLGTYAKPMANAFSRYFSGDGLFAEDAEEHKQDNNPMLLIKKMEEHFIANPTLLNLRAVTERYRNATEAYGQTGDPRYEQLLVDQHVFLQRKDVQDVLVQANSEEKKAGIRVTAGNSA